MLLLCTASQKLKPVIFERGLPLGATGTGADWCLKALHPADPLTEVRGIPDHSAVPSVLMNYQSVYTLTPHAGSVGPWSFNATLLPHPVNFMYVDYFDSVVPVGTETCFLNTQLAGGNHYDKYNSFIGMAQRWRLAYMSVTAYQDGPDLANQGSLVVAQSPVEPIELPVTWNTVVPNASAGPSLEYYTAEDYPNFDTSQAMPNAYFNRSREGAYVPLKLTETCQDWRSVRDDCFAGVPSPNIQLSGAWNLPTVGTYPYPHANCAVGGIGPLIIAAATTGQRTGGMLNGTFAHICAKNLDAATSFTFYVRMGVEMQVCPSSVLSPQMKLSPPHDQVALDTYFAIARELKDAYPADYNDLGKIWEVISRAGKHILPFIGATGPIGSAVSGVGRAAIGLGDVIAERRKSKRNARDKPAAAEVERQADAQKVVRTLAAIPPSRKPGAKRKRNSA